MKKSLTLIFIFFVFKNILFAQTAVDFTASDCNGNSHHLYSELDSGKVIVIAWVMPCGTCVAPSKAAYDAVQSFATSHPGKVRFYLADDYANTNCTSLTNWGISIGISNVAVFSTAAVSMNGYGSPGMPKIVVLGGGTNHTVFFNQNSGVNQSNVTAAINTALNSTSIDATDNYSISLDVYPIPATQSLYINYDLNQISKVDYKIYNVLGEEVLSADISQINIGKNTNQIDIATLVSGTYIFQITINNKTKQTKFTILK